MRTETPPHPCSPGVEPVLEQSRGRADVRHGTPIPTSLALDGGPRDKPGGTRPCWAPGAPGAEEEPGSVGGWGWRALHAITREAQNGGHVGRMQRLEPGASGPRSWGGHGFSPRSSGRSGALPPSRSGPSGPDSERGPPGLQVNKFLFFQPAGLWCSVAAASGYSPASLSHFSGLLCTFWIQVLHQMFLLQITFSQSVTYLFILLIAFFTEQKSSFILMKSSLYIFLPSAL